MAPILYIIHTQMLFTNHEAEDRPEKFIIQSFL